MKIKKIPLGLPQQDVIQRYSKSNNRLIILVIELSLGDFSVIYLEFYIFALLIFVNVMQGFFGTLTEPMNNQNEELDLRLNPELKGTLKALCNDPKTTVVVMSRSGKNILDKVLLMSFFSYLCIISHAYICIYNLTDLVLKNRSLESITYGWLRKMECS